MKEIIYSVYTNNDRFITSSYKQTKLMQNIIARAKEVEKTSCRDKYGYLTTISYRTKHYTCYKQINVVSNKKHSFCTHY